MRAPAAAALPIRIAVALSLAGLLFVVVCQGLSTAMVRAAPARALALAPWSARALTAASTIRFGDGSQPAARQAAGLLAREALLRDPTSVGAVATLGLKAQFDRPAAAADFFRYAELLSRRELRTQLWLIEDAVARGDVRGALQHYDIALRVTPGAAALLHPVLATAIVNEGIRAALIDVFRKRPSWGTSFLEGVSINGPDFASVAKLLLDMRRAGIVVPLAVEANIVGSLVARGDFALAWQMYASTRPGARREAIRDGAFKRLVMPQLPFEWTLPDGDGATATIVADGGLDVQAQPGAGGVVARQLQLLPAGSYQLVSRSSSVAAPSASRPNWTLVCADGRSITRLPLPSSGATLGRSAQPFSVPPDCPAQWLTLVVPPSEAAEGVAFTVGDVIVEAGRY